MTIEEWLKYNTSKLQMVDTKTARLDCLILLEYITRRDRAYILSRLDISLNATQLQKLDDLISKRLEGWPIAYITGHKEFYGLDLEVSPDTLIPRPETEQLIEAFKDLHPQPDWLVADIGTGSGAIALAIKYLYPSINVTATDIDREALDIAQKNANKHRLDINFIQTNLLEGLDSFDVIIANLPYVASDWSVSPDTAYEPSSALYAAQGGLELVYKLISSAVQHLKPHGHIILEHDSRQTNQLTTFAQEHNYTVARSYRFLTVLKAKI